MQEYLSRVAGTLRPEQKTLLQAQPIKTQSVDSLLVSTTWLVPNFEGEVSDISESAPTIKSRYWSIDSVGAQKQVEIFATRVKSTPFYNRKLNTERTADESRALLNDADSFVYFEFKNFILTRLRTR